MSTTFDLSFFTGSSTTSTSGGRTPVNRVSVGNEILDVKASSMTLKRSPNAHDAMTLALSSPTLTDTDNLIGQPISVVYGLGSRTDIWYGYIIQVTEEQKDGTNLNFTLSLLGTTLVMQQGKPRFWTRRSIPAVVRDLVNSHLLGFTGSDHPYLWRNLTQTQESDWQLSAQLSQRLGFNIWNWNGVVICEDPFVLYNGNGPFVRLTPDSDLGITDRPLLEFTPVRDAERTYTGMGVKIAYLTSDGRVGWAEQPNFTKHRFSGGLPLRSQQEAEVVIQAISRQTDGWLQAATAKVKGDPSIFPGQNVDVVTSVRVNDRPFDGKWLVVEVQHSMDNQTFQTQLSLARPDSVTPMSILPYRPFWEGTSLGRPEVGLLGDGDERRWVSSWADTRFRSIL